MLIDPIINIIAVFMKEIPAANQFNFNLMLVCHFMAKVSPPAAALAPMTSPT